MWLTSIMTKKSKETTASKGSVTAASNGRVEVDGSALNRNVPVVAPYGIAYVPPVGEGAVIMPTESGDACVGVTVPAVKNLKPGELMLYSAGGATVLLRNDGKVLINGIEYGGV